MQPSPAPLVSSEPPVALAADPDPSDPGRGRDQPNPFAPETILAQAPAENFPVAGFFLPSAVRRSLLAVYGYARLVDDIGDEAPGDRDALLDAIERDLDVLDAGGTPTIALVAAVAETVRSTGVGSAPLRRLLAANRQDQRVSRYQTFAELLDYCALSANPVGELVLAIFGLLTPQRLACSDQVCSALQVVEHLQDVAEDAAAGRIYLPLVDLRRFGVREVDLVADTATPQLRRLLAFEADRAARLLRPGSALVATLSGRARLAVAGFVAGGAAALRALEDAGYDVLAGPPRPRRRHLVGAALGCALRGSW